MRSHGASGMPQYRGSSTPLVPSSHPCLPSPFRVTPSMVNPYAYQDRFLA